MRAVLEFIFALIILITAGNYASKEAYYFVKRVVVLRIQKGHPTLTPFMDKMSGAID